MQLLCIPGFFTTPGSDGLKNVERQAFFSELKKDSSADPIFYRASPIAKNEFTWKKAWCNASKSSVCFYTIFTTSNAF